MEYIIIDGNSTDNSLNIINRYSQNISKIVSENDNGISDAMNKGINIATGDFILFIHSDDYLLDKDSILHASKYLDDDHDIFAFGIMHGNKNEMRHIKPFGFNKWIRVKFSLPHQGILCNKRLFNKIGNFKSELSYCMDYDFFIRAYTNGAKIKYCDQILSFMSDSGTSSHKSKRLIEEKYVQKINCDSIALKVFYKFYWPLYKFLQILKKRITNFVNIKMTLDIVIPCYNCSKNIRYVLKTLLQQKLDPEWKINIIVVNDCSNDSTKDILNQFESYKIKVVNTPENSGRAFARNIGAKFSESDYILFLDSDCIPQNSTTVCLLLNKISDNKDLVFGSLHANGAHFWANYFNASSKLREKDAIAKNIYLFTSAYFVISRDLFNKIGGFNENYKKYGFEDRDLFIRLSQANANFIFSPGSVVLHDMEDDFIILKDKLVESGKILFCII